MILLRNIRITILHYKICSTKDSHASQPVIKEILGLITASKQSQNRGVYTFLEKLVL